MMAVVIELEIIIVKITITFGSEFILSIHYNWLADASVKLITNSSAIQKDRSKSKSKSGGGGGGGGGGLSQLYISQGKKKKIKQL